MIPPESPLTMATPQSRSVSNAGSDSGVPQAGFGDVWVKLAGSFEENGQNPQVEDDGLLSEGAPEEDLFREEDFTALTEVNAADQKTAAQAKSGDVSTDQTALLAPSSTIQARPTGASVDSIAEGTSHSIHPTTEPRVAQVPWEQNQPAQFPSNERLKTPFQTVSNGIRASKAGRGNLTPESPSATFSTTQLDGRNRRFGEPVGPVAWQPHSQTGKSDVRANQPQGPAALTAGRGLVSNAPMFGQSTMSTKSIQMSTQLASPSGTLNNAQDLSLGEANALLASSARIPAEPQEPAPVLRAGLPTATAPTSAPTVPIVPSDLVTQVQPSELDLLEPAKDANTVLTSPSSTTSTTSVAAVTQTTAPTHHPTVAQQITTAIIQSAGRTTEISLNPEELGRVRISLTPADTGMTVTITSERLETADLMRRNIELLAREFADLGYENLSFNFENSSEGGTGDGQPDDLHHSDTDPGTLPTDATHSHVMSATLSGGLDLKL